MRTTAGSARLTPRLAGVQSPPLAALDAWAVLTNASELNEAQSSKSVPMLPITRPTAPQVEACSDFLTPIIDTTLFPLIVVFFKKIQRREASLQASIRCP